MKMILGFLLTWVGLSLANYCGALAYAWLRKMPLAHVKPSYSVLIMLYFTTGFFLGKLS